MRRYIPIFSVFLLFMGCEDVVEIDTPAEPPRLSVDALIRIDESEPITKAVVEVNLTSSFFDDTEAADLDEIIIQNSDYESSGPSDQNFIVLTESSPGRYEAFKNTSFFTDGRLELSITYGNDRYLASTQYVPAVPIDNLKQGEGELFTGDETEILVSFTDSPVRDDFYLFDFDFNEYLVTDDGFYQGQTFEFSYFYDEDVEPGMEISVEILGIDEPFFNYMNQLIVQAGGDQGPFQTPSATVRGNIVNITNSDNTGGSDSQDNRNNFALGYFAICQTFSESIRIE